MSDALRDVRHYDYEKTRLFGGGFLYIVVFIYTYAPPPFEEDIIMTTTIIIVAITEITLYTLPFNIGVYALRIYTHRPKKELWQAIIF
ncbi:MAG TPA: hypothetical protein VI461_04035 [Chitinophagaceae bacterium]|nr:hypothetical protein [Chitinophagaceae bacterium]